MRKQSVKPLTADQLADKVDAGHDISAHFTQTFIVVRPTIKRVNLDLTAPMLEELDREADHLNVSRQAVIKTMLRDALDRRNLARRPTAQA